jgi:hypothetical protein
VTAQFTLSLLACDRDDPLADFFDARAAVAFRGSAGETTFTVAARDLEAFIADGRRILDVDGASALLTAGWEAEKCLRLQITRRGINDLFVARVWIVSDEPTIDLQTRTETEFATSPDAFSAFLRDIQHLVGRRELGDATLNGDADGNG